MAFILDTLVAIPVFYFLVITLDLAPEAAFSLGDAGVLILLLLLAGVQAAIGFLLEALFGWTLGKRIVGLRVVRLDGSRLTLGAALLRNLLRLIDASFPLGVFLGMSILMATPRRQRLGDLAARTVVVEDRPLPAASSRPRQEPEVVERR
jgi:uncharacterized RDD family membrane protein YckC